VRFGTPRGYLPYIVDIAGCDAVAVHLGQHQFILNSDSAVTKSVLMREAQIKRT
jgi:hypothetical protein